MEKLKNKWLGLPMQRFFIMTVLLTVSLAVLISALIIGGCISFRNWLLPDADAVYLTLEETLSDGNVTKAVYLLKYGQDPSSMPRIKAEYDNITEKHNVESVRYSVQKIESSFDMLSPKRKLAYRGCGVLMVAAPAVLAFAGIILCSIYFYQKKLKRPLELLSDAADKIAKQNLDFEVSYDYQDEMGNLCSSFEKMRAALYENNKAMWEMLEERRILQASVAHDLRNPIAIIEGYSEYLAESVAKENINSEKAVRIIHNLNMAVKRLDDYTESVRLLNQSEEIRLNKSDVNALELAESITEDMRLLAQQKDFILNAEYNLSNDRIQADIALIYRILENVMSNALRYASKEIRLNFGLFKNVFSVTVIDDGRGFPSEILEQEKCVLFHSKDEGHMGIGLAVSRLLCKKHGGSLEIFNTSSGACAKINLAV